jgi:hypothetical protein
MQETPEPGLDRKLCDPIATICQCKKLSKVLKQQLQELDLLSHH